MDRVCVDFDKPEWVVYHISIVLFGGKGIAFSFGGITSDLCITPQLISNGLRIQEGPDNSHDGFTMNKPPLNLVVPVLFKILNRCTNVRLGPSILGHLFKNQFYAIASNVFGVLVT